MGSDWTNKSLDALGRIVTGKTPPSSTVDAFGGSIPFVTPSDMDGTRIISTTARTLSASGQTAVRNAVIPKNAVMVSCIGSDMGKAAIAGIDCITNQQINSIIIDTDDSPLFVYYNLSTRKSEIRGAASGSAQPILNKSAFGRLEIELPPPREQRAIAHILGTLDDKIELNRKQNETLEAMARALFKSWFVDFEPVRAKMAGRWVRGQSLPSLPAHLFDLFPDKLVESELGEIPEGWEVTDFGSVSKCLDKHRIPLSNKQRECRKGVIPYHGATSVMDFVDEYIFDGIYLLLGEDGSVLKEDGTPFIQYIWGKSWVNNHAHVLQGLNDVSTEHLMLFIAAQNITAYVTGAVQLKLNQKNMNSIPFLKARSEINSEFAELIAPFYDQYRELSEQSRTLSQLRDTLLPKLISGELRVPSVMIEGIT